MNLAKHGMLDAFSLDAGMARFLAMSPDRVQQASFLDQRIEPTPDFQDHPFGLSAACQMVGEADCRPRFLFHTAFCASTLFARTLHDPDNLFVFREPQALLSMAQALPRLQSAKARADLFRAILVLVARVSARRDVLFKPTNLANRLIDQAAPAGPTLVLAGHPEGFLLSLLRRGRDSERFVRQMLTLQAEDQIVLAHQMQGQDFFTAAVTAWHGQMVQFDRVAAKGHSIGLLYQSELSADLASARRAAQRFFGVADEPSPFDPSLDAKAPTEVHDTRARQMQENQLWQSYRSEIRAAVASGAARFPEPTHLIRPSDKEAWHA